MSLFLRPKKCKLIPLYSGDNKDTMDEMKRWLGDCCGPWAGFDVVFNAIFLGVSVGPTAHGISWNRVNAKISQRVLCIANTNMSPSIALVEYASRIATVGSYIAQFLPPPSKLIAGELRNLHKVIHCPASTFTYRAMLDLPSFGMPAPSVVVSIPL